MGDFSVVNGRLATGAAIQTPSDVDALIAAGAGCVIDCRAEFDDGPLFTGRGLAYLWAPTEDDGRPKPASYWHHALAFGLPWLSHPHHAQSKLYAHCAAGVNRGPSMLACVMMAQGWTKDEAAAKIRACRPQVGLAYIDNAAAAVATLGYV